jgi:hypothetical protein
MARFFCLPQHAAAQESPGHWTTAACELRLLQAAALGCFSGAPDFFPSFCSGPGDI